MDQHHYSRKQKQQPRVKRSKKTNLDDKESKKQLQLQLQYSRVRCFKLRESRPAASAQLYIKPYKDILSGDVILVHVYILLHIKFICTVNYILTYTV